MGRKLRSVAIYLPNNETAFFEVDRYLMKREPDPEDPTKIKMVESDRKVYKIKANIRKKRVEVFIYRETEKKKESTVFLGFNFSLGYAL